jgi:hypothetical protein
MRVRVGVETQAVMLCLAIWLVSFAAIGLSAAAVQFLRAG